MSANNQTLVKEYKGKFYIFSNIMAESWVHTNDDDIIDETRINELPLSSNAGVFDNRDEALTTIRGIADSDQKMVLTGVSKPTHSAYIPKEIEPSEIGEVNVTDFSFNRLKTSVTIHPQGGAFLYYADSFHPGWQAHLDRQKTPILEANQAFKAVFVPQGTHMLEFAYFGGLNGVVSVGIAVISVFFVLYVLWLLWFFLVSHPKLLL